MVGGGESDLQRIVQRIRYDHTTIGCIHKPEYVFEMHKILWDFGIQTDHLSSARRLDRVLIYRKIREFVI